MPSQPVRAEAEGHPEQRPSTATIAAADPKGDFAQQANREQEKDTTEEPPDGLVTKVFLLGTLLTQP